MHLSRVCLVSCALFLCACSRNVTLIEGQKTLEGNQAVGANDVLRLKDGASLTVNGDLTIDGMIDCEGGAVALTVQGNLTVNNGILCTRSQDDEVIKEGITIVVKNGITIDESAKIDSNGHIQIVDDAGKILSADQLNALYDDVEKDTGTGGPRIGPLVQDSASSSKASPPPVARAPDHWLLSAVSEDASAQAPAPCVDQNGNVVDDCIRIGGTWVVGHEQLPPEDLEVETPERGVKKIVLNFDFGPEKEVWLYDFNLSGPAGRDGREGPKSCNVTGEKGEDAFRFNVNAGAIRIANFTLSLGRGGNGGNAETERDCYPSGTAKGGDGGKAGNFKMQASDEFEITGVFMINPGDGGKGGDATAFAKAGTDGCAGLKGGDATATGGAGGENKKELSVNGTVNGIDNIEIGPVHGGNGGNAKTYPGKGGNGTGCTCAGGPGGKGTATAGKGGDASIAASGVDANEAFGGDGGDADANGGDGGNGGMCDPSGPGGNGGKGGDAVGKEGKGGSATVPGTDGTKIEIAGNGGNGGDGCGPGGPGAGGSPNGKRGVPGKNLCLPPPASSTPMTDPGGRMSSASSTPSTVTGGKSSSASNIRSSAKASSSPGTTSTGPRIVSTNPASGALDVETDVRIQVVFSEPMSRASLQGAIHASFVYEVDKVTDTSIELRPQGLKYDTNYDFSVGTTATGTSGKPLASSTTVKFKTRKQSAGTSGGGTTGTTPPTASSSSQPQEMIQVLIIQNKRVPISQTIVESHDECPSHYHAANGTHVTSLEGSTLPEPGGCIGYGRIEDVPKQMCTPDGTECQ